MPTIKKRVYIAVVAAICIGVLSSYDVYGADRGMDMDKGLDELAGQLTDSLSNLERLTVGVADFWDLQGRVSGFGRHVGEEMSTLLHKSSKKLRVIEWRQLNEVVRELCLNQTDLFDRAKRQKMGRFAGADALLVGTITDMDSTVRINARLIGTESRDSLAAASVTITKDTRVARLLGITLETGPLVAGKCYEPMSAQKNEELPPEQVKGELAYENELIRVSVKSLTRSRAGLVLEVWYENMSDNIITLSSSGWGGAYASNHRGTYLISEGGEKWLFREDTQVGSHYGGTELIPHQRLLNRIVFTPEKSDTGAVFTYVGGYRAQWRSNSKESYRYHEFDVVIRNIIARR